MHSIMQFSIHLIVFKEEIFSKLISIRFDIAMQLLCAMQKCCSDWNYISIALNDANNGGELIKTKEIKK